MKKFKLAVVGKDVSQSESPKIHSFIAARLGFEVEYDKLSIPEEKFEDEIGAVFKAYDGVNVTIPYKLSVISHLKEVIGDAKIFGAVNTVDVKNLSGYNTDGLGFMLMLKNNGVDVSGENVLVLGAGGAGRSVVKKLADGGAKVFVFDRNFENARKVASEFGDVFALAEIEAKPYFALINATGVGMHKTVGISPVGEELLSLCEVAVDLIYTPQKSAFLQIAESFGKKIINGGAMLFYQAYFSDCIYFGLQPNEAQAKQLFLEYTGENI